jgi:hypothetical protein
LPIAESHIEDNIVANNTDNDNDDNLPSDISIDLNHEIQDDQDFDDEEQKFESGKILIMKRREENELSAQANRHLSPPR